MSITIAAISGVVAAAVKYLLASQGLEGAGQKAAEKIGELGGEKLATLGQTALAKLRETLEQRGEAAKRARRALDNVEDDPADEDYQRKLAAELDKLTATDAQLRTLLEQLSVEVQQVGGGGTRSHSQAIGANAQMGAAIAGDNSGTVTTTFNNQRTITTGGSYVEGGVTTGGGDFIGGSKTVRGDAVRGNKIGTQHTINTGGGDDGEGAINRQGSIPDQAGIGPASDGTINMGSRSDAAPAPNGQTRSESGTTGPTHVTAATPPADIAPSIVVLSIPPPPPVAPAPRTRHLVSRFPERVALGARVPLQVRVARSSSASAPSTSQHASVTITVFSAGLTLNSEATRTVSLPADADSEWVPFELEAGQPGKQAVEITAFVGGAFLGTLSLPVTIDSATATGPFIEHSSAVVVRTPAAGEVTLAIRYDRSTQQYRFQLRSATLGFKRQHLHACREAGVDMVFADVAQQLAEGEAEPERPHG